MKKSIVSAILIVFVLLLSSCTSKSESAGNNSGTGQSSGKSGTSAHSDANSTSEMKWPAHMKDLPVPKGTISSVERYVGMKHLTKEDTTEPDNIIVQVTDMTKEDAQDYVKQLRTMGFSGGLDKSDNEKIIFSGVGTNSAAKNGVNFLYTFSTKTATICY
jgi:uncharacterized lipoprotein NlpE involved in copper resistance